MLHNSALTAPLRARLRKWVFGILQKGEGGSSSINFDEPVGDPGLFGPDSVTWRIHADFPGMMSGGICALMLQTLHPLALAGVWDHSSFRDDVLGRLRRTSGFVAGTTFAPKAEALQLIAKVERIHQRVRGTAQDGRAYSADDPDLLTWVHATEMLSFLNGYQRYRQIELPLAIQDRYYAETSLIAERLGARGVPKSAAAVATYFEAVQPQLEYSARSIAVLEVLNRVDLPIPLAGVSRQLFIGAGAALLPPWALQLMRRSRARQLRDRTAARSLQAIAPVLRAALKDGIGAHSCRRVGLDPAELHRSF
ncbi:MAG: hypothetical protein JWR16_462 [Nevskia sp.]|nr:hypothetical protein [Nevskia sp.]